MKRLNLVGIAALAAGIFWLAASPATAADPACTALGGALNGAGECQISASPNNHSGTFNLAETLRITSTGKITVPAAAGGANLTLNITGGLIMEAGSKIVGDASGATGVGANITINTTGDILLAGGTPGAMITANQVVPSNGGSCSGGHSGNITLTSNGGNITTEVGSVIATGQIDLGTNTSKCPAGEIIITTSGQGVVDIDGSVLSQSSMSGTGLNGGGPITIKGGCDLLISDTGVVSSKGLDPGADLVHMEACEVKIVGLVESTGAGHAKPTAGNRCNSDPANHPIGSKHSTYFAGCVEVWSGTTLTILNDGSGNNGEVNADIGTTGGTEGRGWIDLFARGDISITGNAEYAVHSNGGLGQNTDDGGLITVKSSGGQVLTFAKAIQASALTAGGGIGGDVIVEASQNIEFGTASIQAEGTSGGAGGDITAQSFHGAVNGAAPGELNAAPAATGAVNLTACTADPAASYTGVVTGVRTDVVSSPCPAGDPVIPAGVPAGDCKAQCSELPPPCEKATVTLVLNPITGRYPGNKGPDLTFRLDLGHDEDGNTSIQQSITNEHDRNGDGYFIVLVVKDGTGVLGGSTVQSVDISRVYTNTFALFGCSVTLVDPNVHDGLPTGLIELSANSPNHVAPAAPGNIFVMDLHGSGSDVAGWKVVGNGRYMRNVATSNSAVGMWFLGNNNTMHNGNGNNNLGAGILVQGTGNTVDSSDAFGNVGNGVTVVGGTNKILKVDAGDKGKGNGGDGVNVSGGTGNTIQEVDAYSNNGNGISVTGNSNKLLKNNAGDRNKSNKLDGFLVVGASNTIQENDSLANGGNGFNVSGGSNTYTKNQAGDRGDQANALAGFLLSGGGSMSENSAIGNLGDGFKLLTTGFTLTKNVSGGSGSGDPNALCQYKFMLTGNTGTNNKSNNVSIAVPFTGCK